jgi:hypothetical protein
MAGRQGAIRHEEGPASVAEQRVAAEEHVVAEGRVVVAEELAVAGVANRSFVMFLVDREI